MRGIAGQHNPPLAPLRRDPGAKGLDRLALNPHRAFDISGFQQLFNESICADLLSAFARQVHEFPAVPSFAHQRAKVRRALEAKVAAANTDLTDPVERLVGGMRVAIAFALEERTFAIVMMRGLEASTGIDHNLNRGIRADVEALVEAGLARPEAVRSGVRCWG